LTTSPAHPAPRRAAHEPDLHRREVRGADDVDVDRDDGLPSRHVSGNAKADAVAIVRERHVGDDRGRDDARDCAHALEHRGGERLGALGRDVRALEIEPHAGEMIRAEAGVESAEVAQARDEQARSDEQHGGGGDLHEHGQPSQAQAAAAA
jgi:hypothetical protein